MSLLPLIENPIYATRACTRAAVCRWREPAPSKWSVSGVKGGRLAKQCHEARQGQGAASCHPTPISPTGHNDTPLGGCPCPSGHGSDVSARWAGRLVKNHWSRRSSSTLIGMGLPVPLIVSLAGRGVISHRGGDACDACSYCALYSKNMFSNEYIFSP